MLFWNISRQLHTLATDDVLKYRYIYQCQYANGCQRSPSTLSTWAFGHACDVLVTERGYLQLSMVTFLDWFEVVGRVIDVHSSYGFNVNVSITCRIGFRSH